MCVCVRARARVCMCVIVRARACMYVCARVVFSVFLNGEGGVGGGGALLHDVAPNGSEITHCSYANENNKTRESLAKYSCCTNLCSADRADRCGHPSSRLKDTGGMRQR